MKAEDRKSRLKLLYVGWLRRKGIDWGDYWARGGGAKPDQEVPVLDVVDFTRATEARQKRGEMRA